jgi:Ca2+-binding EF-hand superfamily protein
MLTDLQTAKLTHIFNIIDFDSNGTIEKEDFEAIGENLAIIRDFDYGSQDFDRVMGLSISIWDKLEPHIKGNAGSLSDWLTFMDNLFNKGDGFEYLNYLTKFVDTLFSLFDVNNDGVFSQTEYIDLFIGLRTEVRFAPKSFKRIDINGDGIISKGELIKSVNHFMRSDDPEAPGNWLFGDWDK